MFTFLENVLSVYAVFVRYYTFSQSDHIALTDKMIQLWLRSAFEIQCIFNYGESDTDRICALDLDLSEKTSKTIKMFRDLSSLTQKRNTQFND